MYKWTTPTLKFRLKNTTIDLSRMSQIWVTVKDGRRKKHTWDISHVTLDNVNKIIKLTLTQAETIPIAAGIGKVEIRMLTDTGAAPVTKKKTIYIEDTIKGGIIE